MPEPIPRRAQDRLARFLAFLIYEEGEGRAAQLLQRVNEEEGLHDSFFAAIAGDRYMEEILEVDRSNTEINLNEIRD